MCYICNSVCNCGLTDCQMEYDRTFEELIKDQLSTLPIVPFKGSFFSEGAGKISNVSKCHSCEPKIVPELLIPINDNNKISVILDLDLVIKSPHYETILKNANYMDKFNCCNACKVKRLLSTP